MTKIQIEPRSVCPLGHFFQRISDLSEQGQILFGYMVNLAVENATNLWKYYILYISILDWYKI